MDARDLIDKLFLNNGNVQSLLDILEDVCVDLDNKTENSRDRNKILKILNKLFVIYNALCGKCKAIDKDLKLLWNAVIKLKEE